VSINKHSSSPDRVTFSGFIIVVETVQEYIVLATAPVLLQR
jgi:hypothetical protein